MERHPYNGDMPESLGMAMIEAHRAMVDADHNFDKAGDFYYPRKGFDDPIVVERLKWAAANGHSVMLIRARWRMSTMIFIVSFAGQVRVLNLADEERPDMAIDARGDVLALDFTTMQI